MGWLETRADEREDPGKLWPQARTAIVLAHSYAPDNDPMQALSDKERGTISVYAQGKNDSRLV